MSWIYKWKTVSNFTWFWVLYMLIGCTCWWRVIPSHISEIRSTIRVVPQHLRFKAFHSDSPCRNNTNVYNESSPTSARWKGWGAGSQGVPPATKWCAGWEEEDDDDFLSAWYWWSLRRCPFIPFNSNFLDVCEACCKILASLIGPVLLLYDLSDDDDDDGDDDDDDDKDELSVSSVVVSLAQHKVVVQYVRRQCMRERRPTLL